MKKTLLLFLLLPFFGIAQTDLVKWNGPSDANGTIVASTAAVSAAQITAGPNSNLQILAYEGFKGTGWPTTFVKDDNKYFQVAVSAKTGYKLKLGAFNFTYNGESHVDVQRYQVRYSKDNFTTSYLLLDEATTTGKINRSLSLANLTLTQGETLTIRIYGYKLMVYGDLNAPIFLANSNTITQTGNTTPTITGTVLTYDASDINANDDNVTTKKNTAITIGVLNNDTAGTSSINNIVIANQPATGQGTVTVNPDKSLTFNPGNNFTGQTSFKYTISNSTKSSTGTVFVNVDDITPSLVIWNGSGSTPKPTAAVSDSNITASDITTNNTMSFGAVNSGFRVNGSPTSLDYSKYIQMSVSPKTGYKIDLTQFKFTYNSTSSNNAGPKKYQVRYSLDPAFPGNGTSLIAETTAVLNTQTTVTANFPPGVVATQNQVFYIRIYVYENDQYYSDYYLVHDNGGELGPTISGVVSSTNTLTANYDTATTPANQAVHIPVLNNDIIGSIPLQTMTISTQSLNGVAVANGLTDVTFTPTTGFSGETSFVYTLYNGSAYSSAIVYVTVTPPPCAATPTPGINQWNGYVYTYTGTPAPTTYVGTVYENPNFERDVQYGTITGDQSVAADNFCGPVPAENFMVRYLMQTTTTADTYNFTIGGDDGVRLYIDGNLITLSPTGSWGDHGYNVYTAQVPLTAASHSFILEYYEKGGIARVSFSHGAVIATNASLEFGINKWNVYGFNLPDINLQASSFAGMYVDPNLNFDSQLFWNKTKSPSYYSNWQGAPMPIDNFTITYKRKGFPCGRYQLVLPNCDDVAKIFINGVDIFTQNGYSNANVQVNGTTTYFLNENSTVEVRLREDAGDANIALNFIDTPTEYNNGTGTIPPNSTSIKITTNTTLNNDIEVCSCTISPNVVLTVPSNKTLTVNQNITVGTGGKLLLEDGASLLQTSTTTNSYQGAADSFQVLRNTDLVKRYDFTYWSAPLTKIPAYTMHDLSPGTLLDKYQSYDSSANAWKINLNGTDEMKPGVGYAIRAPQNFSITNPVTYQAIFNGIPNNGDYSIQLYATNYSLIGNPYPSAIDAQKFITINHNATPSVDVGSLYFWTHNTPPSDKPSAGGSYDYTSNDYAVLNLSGSTSTGAKRPDGTYEPAPSGKIASCQSFFMKASGPGVVKFTNDMRISGSNNEFYKTTKTNELEKNRIWLNLTSNQGAFKQALVGYIEGATNDWDVNYDASTMNGNSFIDFYSINQADKLSIQGRALPFTDTDRIPFGYKTTVAGDFTIAIDHADGLFDNQAIYLEDKTTGKVIDLKAGNYTFTTAIGTFTDRFTIAYTKKTLGTGDFETTENDLLVSVKEKTIKVTSTKENIKEVAIYDISGKILYNKKKVDAAELQVQNLQSATQVLLVKITLDNDYVVTKKIIFN